jgi:hypothetical protein
MISSTRSEMDIKLLGNCFPNPALSFSIVIPDRTELRTGLATCHSTPILQKTQPPHC